jgi:D-hydroxyproline dehydrogenase
MNIGPMNLSPRPPGNSAPAEVQVAVIGAGVIGLACAYRLIDEGHEVVLIDPEPPGSGASYGNAGTIADYATQPVGTPDVLKNLPRLLFDRNSPLAILQGSLPTLAPWLVRFVLQSFPGPAYRNAAKIATLLADAGDLWRDLASAIGGGDILSQKGAIYLYDSKKAARLAERDMTQRRSLGVRVDMIGAEELHHLEPGIAARHGGAAYFPDAIFMTDPGLMVGKLASAVTAPILPHRVERLEASNGRVCLYGEDFSLAARKVVIAAGAHSRPLARQAGDNIPLDTERGYHVEWDMDVPLLSRPVCKTSRGFYLCPMSGRLRAAGTVELGGLTKPPSQSRIDRLIEGARDIFPELGDPSRQWLGFRPSLPDSLPVIGPARKAAGVIHAFGHGHIGMTLAPITARIVADLVAGRAPQRDIQSLRPGRF